MHIQSHLFKWYSWDALSQIQVLFWSCFVIGQGKSLAAVPYYKIAIGLPQKFLRFPPLDPDHRPTSLTALSSQQPPGTERTVDCQMHFLAFWGQKKNAWGHQWGLCGTFLMKYRQQSPLWIVVYRAPRLSGYKVRQATEIITVQNVCAIKLG